MHIMCSLEWVRDDNTAKLFPKDGVLQRIKAFFEGEAVCIRCGGLYYSEGSFGPLLVICPRCYRGEKNFLWRRSVWTGKVKPTVASS